MTMKIIVTDQPCGYRTEKKKKKIDRWKVQVKIISECPDVHRYGEKLNMLNMKDVLTRIPENKVYRLADLKHSTCIVPYMILKACEIELGLNVKKFFKFEVLNDD